MTDGDKTISPHWPPRRRPVAPAHLASPAEAGFAKAGDRGHDGPRFHGEHAARIYRRGFLP